MLPFINEPERKQILAAKNAVKLAKFAKLQRAVNDLAKSQGKMKLTSVALLDKLIEILSRYPLDAVFEATSLPLFAAQTPEELRPEIIISESFSS